MRVITGEDQLGLADEGEYLALLAYRGEPERVARIGVGEVDGDAMFEPGFVVATADVPADTHAVGLAFLSCPEEGCRALDMRIAMAGLDEGQCRTEVQVAADDVVDLVFERPSLGPMECRVVEES